MSSFEIKTRQAIEKICNLIDKHEPYLSREDKWRRSVEIVLRILSPFATIESSWAESIRDELIRLQNEEGLLRKAAIDVLEARLDHINLHQHRRLIQGELKRTRNHSERKYIKKVKHTKKRTREER